MTAAGDGANREATRPKAVKSPQDLAAGIFLLTLAGIGYLGASSLAFGKLSGMGPGLLPKVVATLLAAFGLFLIVEAFTARGESLERWSLRGIVFVLGAAVVFALLVRGLGLIVAGPAAVMVAALASHETRWLEAAVFAVVLTLVCGLLFKELLNLPIPFDPQSVLEPLHQPYRQFKVALRGLVFGR